MRLPYIFKTLGLKIDEKVLPSIGNEVLKAVVAQFNADQLLTKHPQFSKAVEQKQVAQQEAERSKFVVMKAEQERGATIIRAEGESESAKLISDATAAARMGLIELKRIETSREVAATLAKTPHLLA
ncbi:Prohibitin-4, mitochondrial [Capsicum annuum]|nr:Prohibitin-4, mitochondrial [Capsicum annuum]